MKELIQDLRTGQREFCNSLGILSLSFPENSIFHTDQKSTKWRVVETSSTTECVPLTSPEFQFLNLSFSSYVTLSFLCWFRPLSSKMKTPTVDTTW